MYFRSANRVALLYSSAFAITCGGLAYSLVPLYKIICQNTGITGTPQTSGLLDQDRLKPLTGVDPINIRFVANTGKDMPWKFIPLQSTVQVVPGQTALAFYSATNPTGHDITGLATYNIVPAKAARYFNKVQCFCFEEQRLGAGEQVDMPVFFFLDPDYATDPNLKSTKEIVLSYTFFQTKK